MIPALDPATLPNNPGNETDRLALLDFKNRITSDPLGIMACWDESVHFCSWVGVTCSPSTGRVVSLSLASQGLTGSMPPSLGNLSFLTEINLRNNSFLGEIPQQIGLLTRLQVLNLTYNNFGGKIPTNLSNCRELEVLTVAYNGLVGQIPGELRSLSKLSYMGLGRNHLTGKIPTWVGNFSSLFCISLHQNSLQGDIPKEIGKLSGLKILQVFGNELTGMIPSSIYNISSIYYFSVTQNRLQGELPPDVGLKFPNLSIFAGGVNGFTGRIPPSLPNASGLQVLDFAQNELTGTLPTGLGRLQSLYRLNFDENRLGSGKPGDLEFLASLANCSGLEVLGLSQNVFGGSLPTSIANLSRTLRILTLGFNMVSGILPDGIGNLFNLNLLGLEGNYFNGTVPDELGKLQNLAGLQLNMNRFSGLIPSSFGNLTALTRLFMEENRLEGSMPPSLGNCTNLQVLNLSSNNLSGAIPKEVIGLSSLSISLSMANNSLSGSLPFEVGKLTNLKELHISENKISGEFPGSLGSCLILESLLMGNNFFQGTIPQSLQSLRALAEIDLSHNNFSGQIPRFLQELSSLNKLDVSFNNLWGQVPSEGIFSNASAISLVGNGELCGGIPNLHLPTCSREMTNPSRNFLTSRAVVLVVVVAVILATLLSSVAIFCVVKTTKKRPLTSSSAKEWQQMGISYQEILKSTNGFSTNNLIGSGSFGSVYKGSLPTDGTIVAIKVLNLQQQGASKSFMDECKALSNIRHRNLLKLLTACSSVDHQGNDFKALVYEFMGNGSLDQWLHPPENWQGQSKRLNMMQRLDIAMDVAYVLEYLHHHCQTPIVHCDLKPSNVLLDQEMTAHVGDFGLASFVFEASDDQTISDGLKGSIGYIAPECGVGLQVSTVGDVYSYGILLLEMFTGKRPTDDMFKDGLGIHSFVAMALPEHAMDIIDPYLLLEVEEVNDNENDNASILERATIGSDLKDPQTRAATSMMEECLVSVLSIGLSCSNSLPSLRMPMNVISKKVLAIRDSFRRLQNWNRRRA